MKPRWTHTGFKERKRDDDEDSFLAPCEEIRVARFATSFWWVHVLLGLATVALGAFALASRTNAVSTLVALISMLLLCSGAAELTFGATLRPASWLAVLAGAASITFGIVALIWPAVTLLVLTLIVGLSLLAWGFYDIVVSATDPLVRPRSLGLLSGIALATLGVVAMARPTISAAVLGVLVAVLLVVQGVLGFVTGLQLLDAHRAVRHLEQGVRPRIKDTTGSHRTA